MQENAHPPRRPHESQTAVKLRAPMHGTSGCGWVVNSSRPLAPTGGAVAGAAAPPAGPQGAGGLAHGLLRQPEHTSKLHWPVCKNSQHQKAPPARKMRSQSSPSPNCLPRTAQSADDCTPYRTRTRTCTRALALALARKHSHRTCTCTALAPHRTAPHRTAPQYSWTPRPPQRSQHAVAARTGGAGSRLWMWQLRSGMACSGPGKACKPKGRHDNTVRKGGVTSTHVICRLPAPGPGAPFITTPCMRCEGGIRRGVGRGRTGADDSHAALPTLARAPTQHSNAGTG
jgi:hypothetical protein